jgi:hypothetical protein
MLDRDVDAASQALGEVRAAGLVCVNPILDPALSRVRRRP